MSQPGTARVRNPSHTTQAKPLDAVVVEAVTKLSEALKKKEASDRACRGRVAPARREQLDHSNIRAAQALRAARIALDDVLRDEDL